jgi:ammonia channel protein AmtB
MQILYQLLSIVVASVWSFVITFIILQFIGLIPFMRLKLTEDEEEMYNFIIILKILILILFLIY